jgi:ubiquinone biosynthesis protein
VGPVPTKHLDRYRHIAGVLADEGLHAVVDGTGLRSLAPKRRTAAAREDRLTPEQHVRQAIEKLGVTFIKVGQAASTRTDVIPPRLAEELRKLQDEVTPEPFATIKSVVERELEQPLEQAFASFDPEPMAAASIGQVHRATLPDGTAGAL